MTQPLEPVHLHGHAEGYEYDISVRRKAVNVLQPLDGGYDFDTGRPTQFYVMARVQGGDQQLRLKTFATAQERDDYIRNDPDGLLA